ncbi:hypothetical protein C6499_06535 [Candidatus Poribacteria bacterium]|nr:MAG: hypothetical protein C6499_06535 [Candidatus Poribacteria bacterium]
MDLFKNPFHILGATTRDNRHSIMELADERSLLSDADECMEARAILTNPRRRTSAEVAWLPGVDPSFYGLLFRYLESPNEELPSITMAPIVSANLRATKLSRHPGLSSSDIVEWILTIAQTSESINSETVCAVLNGDRRASGLPEITDMSTVDDAIRNQKRYYSQTVTSVLENLSVNARARVMTSLLETTTSNGRYQCPTLIRDLIPAYEGSVQDSLEQHERIIEAQDAQLRAMADAQHPDTTLSQIVDQLLESLQEWDTLVQPIQLSRQNTGQRHDASSEMARRFRQLAANLFGEYRRPDFSRRILNTLRDVFSEVPEIVEQISDDLEDLRELEEQARLVEIIEEFENINTQAERLREASDARQSDYTLSPMVNQLIQSVRSWDTTQSVDANSGVAFTVREVALHLCNEHQELDFAIQITNALIDVFNASSVGVEVVTRLTEDKTTLVGMRSFENINTQVEQLKTAADARHPDYTLTPMVNRLIQSVKSWDTTQPIDTNNAVAIIVRNIALHLWNEHQELDFATQITNALIGVFQGVHGMDEVNNQLSQDITTLAAMNIQRRRVFEQQRRRSDTGCLLQIVIFAAIGVIVALLQGC